MKVLRVIANPKTVESSASLKIEQAFMSALLAKHPDAQVSTIDLYAEEIPLLDAKLLPAFFGAPPADAEVERQRERQKAILEQFLAADVVVIASPVWNFNAPPKLKAFMDTVMVAGKTFKYTPQGPLGLIGEKKVVLCSASGLLYGEGHPFQETLSIMLKNQFAFMGVNELTILTAPGQGTGREQAAASTAAAIEQAQAAAAAL